MSDCLKTKKPATQHWEALQSMSNCLKTKKPDQSLALSSEPCCANGRVFEVEDEQKNTTQNSHQRSCLTSSLLASQLHFAQSSSVSCTENFTMVLGKLFLYTTGPNNALIKSTGQITIGGRLHALPIIHRVDSLGLELRTITVHTEHGTTVNGVAVDVIGCCQIKIEGWSSPTGDDGAHGSHMRVDYDAVRLAAQHFIGKSDRQIADTIHRTVEGHQRAIIGTLTVEELYNDRVAFSRSVKELCEDDLRNMGLCMVSYTMAEITDDKGYIQALGVRQTEKVKREATEGAALHQGMAKSKKGKQEAVAHLKVNRERERMTESDKLLQVKRSNAQNEIDRAVAIQKKAGRIEDEEQNAILFVEQQNAEAAWTEAELEVLALRVERARLLREIDVAIPADAELYKTKIEADIVRVRLAAEADRIRVIARAEADIARTKGLLDVKTLGDRVRV